MKRTAKDRGNAELDAALGDICCDCRGVSQRIRDLFARVQRERNEWKKLADQSTGGMVESWQNAVPLAEVREMLIAAFRSGYLDTWKTAPEGANDILREHGYGGEP